MSSGEGPSLQKINLSSRKISSNIILRVSDKIPSVVCMEIKVIVIKCEKFLELIKLLRDLSIKNFPNAFVVSIEVINEDKYTCERLKNEINRKFNDNRPILLEVNSKYFLRKKKESFSQIELNLSEEDIQTSLSDSKFSTEIFLSIQRNLNFSEIDFEKFSKYFKAKIEGLPFINPQKVFIFSGNDHILTQKLFLSAINSQDNFCIRLLNLFDLKIPQNVQNEIFQSVIRSNNFEIFLAFFGVFKESEIETNEVQRFLDLSDYFQLAVNCNNVEVVRYFLRKVRLSMPRIYQAIDKAIKSEFFEVFNEIKDKYAESIDEEFNVLISKGKEILDAIDELHENIRNGNFDEVKSFTENFPDYKLCYGLNDVCALELSIDEEKCETYAFLRCNGFYTDKGRELDGKIKNLSNSQCEIIKEENLKYTQKYPNAFIGILLSKFEFDARSPLLSNDVREMLHQLSTDGNLKPFLQIASEADLKIIFDFATESVKTMVPEYDEHTMGLAFFSEGKLYVGRDRSRLEMYGTFMHELTHMVLYMLYENECLPYCEGDTERKSEWEQILENVKDHFDLTRTDVEPIIRWVGLYDKGYQQLAELAVRPNHIMARYLDNPIRFDELRSAYAELFNFVRDRVLPDLETKNIFRLLKLNNDFGVIEKIKNETLNLKESNALEILHNRTENFVLTSNIPKLALLKVFDDIIASYENKLHVKAKNIFVHVGKMQIRNFKNELFDLIKTSELDRIIFDATEIKGIQKIVEYLTELPTGPHIIVVCGESDSALFNFTEIRKNFAFEDLRDESKLKIRQTKIDFQGLNIAVSKVCKPLFDEIFSPLCKGENLSINKVSTQGRIEHFIPRTIRTPSKQKSEFSRGFREINFKELNFDEFLDSVQNERVVLISNVAGSGKSTLLREIYRKYLLKYPYNWISFVSLIEHANELSKDVDEGFQETFCKILKLDKVEQKLFTQKFSKGEVKILFDGVDEISPHCKEQTLKFFKKFQDKNQNQIFITTRTHLESDLKEELKIKGFEIKPLSDDDQIKFLCNFWKNSHPDEKFVETCALQLVKKISKIIKNYSNLIGIPIILQSIAILFIDKIDENFTNEIENLKLSKVYKKIFEESLKILAERFQEKCAQNSLKNLSIRHVLKYLTLKYYFHKHEVQHEELINSLGFSYNKIEWPLEEVARSGILSYDKYGGIRFNHETYYESFLSEIMENILLQGHELSNPQMELFVKILLEKRFEITRMFLNENFGDIAQANQKLFKTDKTLHATVEEFSFFESILKLSNEKFLGKILTHQIDSDYQSVLMTCICQANMKMVYAILDAMESLNNEIRMKIFKAKDERGQFFLFKILWSERDFYAIFKFLDRLMSTDEIFELLNEKDKNGGNVLHLAADFAKSKEIFEFLWFKVCEKFKDDEKGLKAYLSVKGIEGRNLLMSSTLNEETFYFVFEDIFEKLLDFENFIYECDDKGQNLLHFIAKWGSVSMLQFTFKKLQDKLSEKKLKRFLRVKSKVKQNIFHRAAKNQNFDAVKLLVEKIEKILRRDELKAMLNEEDIYDRSPVDSTMFMFRSPSDEDSNYLLVLAISLCENNEEIENFIKMRKSKDENILTRFVKVAPQSFLEKVFEIEGKTKIKSFLRSKDHRRKKLLSLTTQNPNLDSIEYLWKIFEENLSREEILELLYEKDESGNNFLHLASAWVKSKEIFEFLLIKIRENLKNNDEKLKNYLKSKEKWGRNILMTSIIKKNENAFFFIFENIFEKFFDFKDFIYELEEDDNENFLHLLARFGSVSMLEFALKKLEEKLSKDEVKNFLMTQSNRRPNLLFFENSNLDSIQCLLSNFERLLNPQELKEMLNQKDEYGNNPFHFIIIKENSKTCKYFAEFCEKNFTKTEIKEILGARDSLEFTALMIMKWTKI